MKNKLQITNPVSNPTSLNEMARKPCFPLTLLRTSTNNFIFSVVYYDYFTFVHAVNIFGRDLANITVGPLPHLQLALKFQRH
jgi:hypothetical protein